MASTPSAPSARSAASSVASPMSGSGSIFQSPVWTMVPRGVRMAMALGSGIEWVMVMNSSAKGPSVNLPPSGTTRTFTLRVSSPASSSLSCSRRAVNGVA